VIDATTIGRRLGERDHDLVVGRPFAPGVGPFGRERSAEGGAE
jgi:hypothetical protein